MAFRHGTEICIVEVSPLSAANELGTLSWYKKVGQVRVVTVTADAPKDRSGCWTEGSTYDLGITRVVHEKLNY